MKIELREDDETRQRVFEVGMQAVKPVRRVCIVVGLPIALVWSLGLYWMEPDRTSQFLVPVPAVLLIGLHFYLIPFLYRLFRNRWIIDDRRIRFRGNVVGSLKRKRIGGWSIREFSDLPGYYNLTVRGWANGADITLSEEEYPREEVEKLFPVDRRMEFEKFSGKPTSGSLTSK